jgi:hypothetical protein
MSAPHYERASCSIARVAAASRASAAYRSSVIPLRENPHRYH